MDFQELIERGVSITLRADELKQLVEQAVISTINRTKTEESDRLVSRIALINAHIATSPTLQRWEQAEYLMPVRIGRKVFYKASDLKRLNINIPEQSSELNN